MHFLKQFIIGETAYNHQGEIDYLFQMIDDIADLELNAVKFHLLLNPKSYMQKKHPLINELKKWCFKEEQWIDILSYTNKKNIKIVALCDDVESIQFINKKFCDIFAIELHATGLNDYFLLAEAANFKGLVILGVGGSTLEEIQYAIELLNSKEKNDILLMYGFQTYPTDYKTINLSKMLKLKNIFQLPIGYADHTAFDDTNNIMISVMAAMMGFNVLEKHYTPDPGQERIDFHAAVGKQQMRKIKTSMELALQVYGAGDINITDAELDYGNTGPMKKAIVAKSKIKKGEKLSIDKLWFKRTEEQSPIKQNMFVQLPGLKAIKDIDEDEIIDFSKVQYEFKKTSAKDFTKIKKN